MFSPLHKLLVDDFASIIFARLDVNRLLDDRIRPAAQGLASAVLSNERAMHRYLISGLLIDWVQANSPGKERWLLAAWWSGGSATEVAVGKRGTVSGLVELSTRAHSKHK